MVNETVYNWLESMAKKLGDQSAKEFNEKIANEDLEIQLSEENYGVLTHHFDDAKESLSLQFSTNILRAYGNENAKQHADYKIDNILQNDTFFEEHLSELLSKYEGFACCSDKAKHLLDIYIYQYLCKGIIPEIIKKEKEFWKPYKGTGEQWMTFIDSLSQLLVGRPSEYFKAYKELEMVYTEGVPEKKKQLDDLLTKYSTYVSKEDTDNGEVTTYQFTSGEETATVIVNVVATPTCKFRLPEMKGVRWIDAIKNNIKYEAPEWAKEIFDEVESIVSCWD